MAEKVQNQYIPDEVSPPRDTLRELIEERGMSQTELAKRMGKTLKAVNEILSDGADVSITPDTALQLEQALGLPARFWLNREQNYREAKARLREREQREEEIGWLDCLPLADLRRRGLISSPRKSADAVRECLAFFGVASVESWKLFWAKEEVAYHMSSAFESELGHLASWLRCAELSAMRSSRSVYSPQAFEAVLPRIRALTTEPIERIVSALVSLAASAGVSVVFVPEFPKTHVCGAARWICGGQVPLIALSLRYRTDDYFWFTFFHEACHILKHAKKPIYVDNKDPVGARIELEANRFSGGILIPESEYTSFVESRDSFLPADMVEFSARIRIAPGVVVGRLQHDGLLDRRFGNRLKRRFGFGEEDRVCEARAQ